MLPNKLPWLALAMPLLLPAQSVPVNFNNLVLGLDRLVYDLGGQPLVGTNWQAQLFLDTTTGLVAVGGSGTGLFRAAGTSSPGTWSGASRDLPGVNAGQTVQLEVRVWDVSQFGTYDAASAAGGVTGTSGLFSYTFAPGNPPSPTDSWLKNLTTIRLVDAPAPPPLVKQIHHPTPGEGDPLPVTPEVTGGTAPLRYLWQLPNGRQDTNRVVELGGVGLRPGIIDFNLTVTDADGRSTPPAVFRIDVPNRAPEILTAGATGAREGEPVAVSATAAYGWPPAAVRATWSLADGRSVSGLDALLPLLSPGRHTVTLRVGELGLVSLYDNFDSVGEPATYHVPQLETGDEVIFSRRTNEVIHEIAIYYYADLTAMTPAERAKAGGRLRLYRNDGPQYPGLSARVPGTVLYESPVFGLNSGYFLQRFPEVNVPAPDRLTWTVIWTNLPQTAGRNAGLVVGDAEANPAPSNTGFSHNDYWVNEGPRWESYRFPNFKPVANFATRATAVDTNLLATSLAVSVTFEVTNVPPVVVSLAAPTDLVAGQSGNFQAQATDVGGGPLGYRWEFGDGQTADGAATIHAYSAVGTFSGRLRVTDSHGGETVREFSVAVTADRQPLVFTGLPPIGAVQDQEYLGLVAVNPPGIGQTVNLHPVKLPAWLTWSSIDSISARFVGRPGNAEVGPHEVVIEATDGTASERLAFTLVVANVNDAPTLSVPGSFNVAARQGSGEVVVTLADPDPADALTLAAVSGNPTLLPADRIVLGGTGRERTLRILPTEGPGGIVPVVLTVSDGALSAQATVQVTLVPPPSFAVSVATSPGGSVTLSPAADRYEQGFRVLATAAPLPGWELRKWTGLPEGPMEATGLDLVWSVTADTVFGGEFADIAAPLVQWEGPAAGLADEEIVTLTGRITDNDRVSGAQLLRPGLPPFTLNLADGRYAVPGVRLEQGSNPFTVIATDPAGNATTNRTVLVWQSGSSLLVGDAPDTREGQTVNFPVQLQNRRALSGLSFNLRFGDYVDFLGQPAFEPSGLLPGALITVNTNVPGTVRVTLATAGQSLAAGRHNLGTFRLRVRSLPSPIGLQAFVDPELLEVADELGDPVPGVGGISGQARLLPRRLTADLNGNQRLDIGDASLLQRLLVGLDPKRSWDTALNDLNKNGSLDSGDVVRLMRVVIGQDPQPAAARTAGSAWPAARAARRAGGGLGWLELDPPTLPLDRGQIVEIRVKVRAVPPQLRGLRFTLAYPPDVMGLIGPESYDEGPALPPGSNPYWFTQSFKGRLHFGLSAETNWPVTTGVLAKFKFYVAETLPAAWKGEFGLVQAEFTYDGYDLETATVDPVVATLDDEVLVPSVSRFRINEGGGLQFNLLARMGAVVVVEGTPDLNLGPIGWRPLGTRAHDGLPLFLAPDTVDGGPPQQFYRVRAKAPALLNPLPPMPGPRANGTGGHF
jgi:hypothetical protein